MKDLSRLENSKIWQSMKDDDKKAIRTACRILSDMWHVSNTKTYDDIFDNFDEFAHRKNMILHVATIMDVQAAKIIEFTAVMNFIATAVNHTSNVW